ADPADAPANPTPLSAAGWLFRGRRTGAVESTGAGCWPAGTAAAATGVAAGALLVLSAVAVALVSAGCASGGWAALCPVSDFFATGGWLGVSPLAVCARLDGVPLSLTVAEKT
ncbi:MAG TPA: hypothetical protein VK493_13575, partial [Bryobacteraceae bacterium]|nr:hypothetical protein [Bryobacteraceae bacterium]